MNFSSIVPNVGLLVVRKFSEDQQEVKKGSLILPSVKRQGCGGIVVAVAEKQEKELDYKIGDAVVWNPYHDGQEVQVGEESLLLIDKEDILGILKEPIS